MTLNRHMHASPPQVAADAWETSRGAPNLYRLRLSRARIPAQGKRPLLLAPLGYRASVRAAVRNGALHARANSRRRASARERVEEVRP
jgi:hypothetical protein